MDKIKWFAEGFEKRQVLQSLIVFFLLIGWNALLTVHAQNVLGARGAALNHAVSALPEYEWSLFANPALLPFETQHVSFYFIRYYNFEELSDVAATYSKPFAWGTLAAGFQSYGFELYRESSLSIAYRYRWNAFNIAVKGHYDHIAIAGPYGSNGAIGLDVGVAAEITETLWISAVGTNLNRPQIGAELPEDLPRSLTIGTSWLLSDRIRWMADVYKDVRFPLSVRSGLEVQLIEQVHARVGAGTRPENLTFGAGFLLKGARINIVTEYHSELGLSPGIDIGYTW